MARRRKYPTIEEKRLAEEQIDAASRQVKFTITEYSVEFLAEKIRREEYYVPEYQRELTWKPVQKSRFVESVLIGLPIPFIFFWQDDDGRFEIVDGSQRLRTIREFMDDELKLTKLQLLTAANGFYFSDLDLSRQRRFQDRSIRGIILDNDTSAATRTEMFSRINTGGTNANEAEIRRGALPGPITDLIVELARDPVFVRMTPISASLVKLREREELVVRFLAYTSRFQPDPGGPLLPGYQDRPKDFIYEFVDSMNKRAEEDPNIVESLRSRFGQTVEFVERKFPNGFLKPEGRTQIPRVRFEAIAIGSALALQEQPELFDQDLDVEQWLNTDKFLEVTTSDGANVRRKLVGRIEFVRNRLLGIDP